MSPAPKGFKMREGREGEVGVRVEDGMLSRWVEFNEGKDGDGRDGEEIEAEEGGIIVCCKES